MKRIAQFYKVSFEQFSKDFKVVFKDTNLGDDALKKLYEEIKLPARATKSSAGYDFYLPFGITMQPGETLMIPTGIRMQCADNAALFIMPKSGLGSKYRLVINNTAGLIDSDYYYSDNEGHIHVKLLYDTHDNTGELSLPAGKSFVQGILFEYGITVDDDAKGVRNGGFGSTK